MPARSVRVRAVLLVAAAVGVASAALAAVTKTRVLAHVEVFPVGLVLSLLVTALGLASSAARRLVALGAAAAIAGSAAALQYVSGVGGEWIWLGLLGSGLSAAILLVLSAPQRRIVARAQGGQPPPPVEPTVPEGIEDETVEVILEAMRALVEEENRRADSLNARGTGLAGFAGITVTLLGALAKTAGGHSGRQSAAVLLAISLGLLVSAVLGLLFGVLQTRSVLGTSVEEAQLYLSLPFVSQPPTAARGRIAATLLERLRDERLRNDRKAQWLNFATIGVAAGIAAAAVAAATILL